MTTPLCTPAKVFDKHPIRRLATAAGACSAQAGLYGKCIGASYKEIEKGVCKEEFKAFKECVQSVVKRKW